ncbi:MAG: response regulator [Firmicutes bacterium]|nr:response regulator [Bacillota bacterium]
MMNIFYKKNDVHEKNHSHSKIILIVGILLIVVTLSTLWLLQSSQNTTAEAVYNVSKLYLEELTTQQVNQVTTTLNSQIQQLSTVIHSLRASDTENMIAAQSFIKRMKDLNAFDFLAFIDEKGTVYTEDATFPGISKFTFLASDFTKPVISFDQSMENSNLLLFSVPVINNSLEGHKLIAATAGINADTVSERLSLTENNGKSFSNVIMPNGGYVIRTNHTHIAANTNMLSTLQQEADFTDENALDHWRRDLNLKKANMVVYELKDVVHYTYYMPIEGTDWFITTTLHYDLISENVDVIRTTLTRNSLFQLMLILLVLFFLFIVYNSMRRRNDKLQLEKIKAEEGNRAKSIFLSNMSHDIRTPMNAIIGFTNLAIKSVDDTNRTQDYLSKILASSNHLLALINDVLEMSRIESGKIQLEETECNLPEMLHDINSIVLGQVQNKQLHLLMDAVDITNENIYCDKLRMNQIFLNLLSNAIKFTPAGGKISVKIEQLQNAPDGYGKYVIKVKDTGIGMTQEFAAKIFNPFERERTSTVSGIQGTGLGMTITKNIVDMMDGTINIITAPGKGSEFIITINLKLHEKQNKPVKFAHLEGVKALIVDDDFDSCDAATRMLMKLDMQAEWTMSGKEAVLRAKQAIDINEAFGAYIIDLRLPDLDGIEVARQIRSVAGNQVPILLITAYDWTQIEKEAREAGVNAFCNKPVFMSDLQSALSKATGQKVIMPQHAETEEHQFDFNGKRILLVEDNELNREIALEILTEVGLNIDEAEDGSIAVEKIRSSEPGFYDLILMDIQMPVMDGYEATKAIRSLENKKLANIPIIAMTANAFEEDKKAAFDAGMNSHLAKPLDVEKLFATLAKVINK